MHYFKNRNPQQPVWLSNIKTWARFTQINQDEGIFITTRQDVANDLRIANREHRSGVVEISEAEYKAMLAKKNNSPPSSRKWRQELSPTRKQRDTASPPPLRQPVAQPANPVAENKAQILEKKKLEREPMPIEIKPKATRKKKE